MALETNSREKCQQEFSCTQDCQKLMETDGDIQKNRPAVCPQALEHCPRTPRNLAYEAPQTTPKRKNNQPQKTHHSYRLVIVLTEKPNKVFVPQIPRSSPPLPSPPLPLPSVQVAPDRLPGLRDQRSPSDERLERRSGEAVSRFE